MNYSPTRIRKDFSHLIDSITPDDVGKSKGDFTRNRRCNLSDTIKLLLTMEGHSLNTEVSNYFTTVKKAIPSKSAFSQQRDKLTDDALPDLFAAVNRLFPFTRKYKGLHLLAVDGSDVNIPSFPGDTSSFVLYNSRNGGFHQLELNAVYDLLEKRYIDAISTPCKERNENRDLCIMVDRNPLDGRSLYIADRGYCAFNTFAHIVNAGQFFLIRAKAPSSKTSFLKHLTLPDADEFDISHTFIFSRNSSGKDTDPSVYKQIKTGTTFDYIEPDDKVSTFELSFRLVKVLIRDGQYEYLMTNLPRAKFPLSDVKNLYRARWGIETSFLKLKYNLALTYFHSKKRNFIHQEIFARLIMYNLSSLLIGSVKVKERNTKYTYVVAFSDAVPNCRLFLLTRMTGKTLKNLLLMSLTPIRPGRCSSRNVRSQRLKTLNNRF